MRRGGHNDKKKKAVTLADLAKMTGLDKSSVSLALRDSPKISATTRDRVQQAADRVGYRPNLAARHLRTGTPRSIGLVLPDTLQTLSYTIAVQTIQSLSRACAGIGGHFYLFTPSGLTRETLPDGLLVWGDVPFDAAIMEKTPLVVVDPNHLSYQNWPGARVEIANYNGGVLAAEYLLEDGCDELWIVQGNTQHLGHLAREQGAADYWQRTATAKNLHRMPPEKVDCTILPAVGTKRKLGIFCTNDFTALTVWRRVLACGLQIPDQVRLLGFDNETAGSAIGLTSFRVSAEKLATVALDLLQQQLPGHEPILKTQSVPVRLVVRET